MSVLFKSVFLSSVSLCVMGVVSPVLAGDSLYAALTEGKISVDARYRYEFIDQAGLSENAHSQTLRTRLGYTTGDFYGFTARAEGENIQHIGPDNFNDTLNGRTDHPVVADPEDTLFNELYLNYSAVPDTNVKVGRQIFVLDNHRFLGRASWRQNDMTFDAAKIQNTSLPDTTLTYGYIWKATRALGTDTFSGQIDVDNHVIHAENTSTSLGRIALYGYLFDNKDGVRALDSNKTFGASLNGKQSLNDVLELTYLLEYANQSDYGSNNVDYNADYYHVSPGVVWGELSARVGFESLGSDNGNAAVTTLLAGRHGHNGWADIFLNTPANGLEDAYVEVGYKVSGESLFKGLALKAQYHEFSAENGGAKYGEEFDFSAVQPIGRRYYVGMKYADYKADTYVTDKQRIILNLGVKF